MLSTLVTAWRTTIKRLVSDWLIAAAAFITIALAIALLASGPIYADAGIIRHRSGHQVILAVFLEGEPRYRGSFIAELTNRVVHHVIDEK